MFLFKTGIADGDRWFSDPVGEVLYWMVPVDLKYWVWLKLGFFLGIQDFDQQMQKSLDFGTESMRRDKNIKKCKMKCLKISL